MIEEPNDVEGGCKAERGREIIDGGTNQHHAILLPIITILKKRFCCKTTNGGDSQKSGMAKKSRSYLWDVGGLLMRDRAPIDAGEPWMVLEVLDAVLSQPHLGSAY